MLVPCKVCGEACKGACSGCGEMCKGCEDCFCPQDKPSPVFTIYTFVVNGILLLFAVLGMVADPDLPDNNPAAQKMWDDSDGAGKANTWLGVCLGIAIGNMLFACYLYYRFTQKTRGQGAVGAGKAACKLLMYDVGVFVFMIFAIFQCVWAGMKGNYEIEDIVVGPPVNMRWSVGDPINDKMGTCQLLIFIYVFLGGVVMLCSICMECGRKPGNQQGQQGQGYPGHSPGGGPSAPYNAYPPQGQSTPPAQYTQPPQQQQYPQQQQQPAYGGPPPQQPPGQPPQQATGAQKAGAMVGAALGKFGKK